MGAAQRLGALFAQNPADRIGNIGFAAAVGPYNGGHPALKMNKGFVTKRLKADELYFPEIQGGSVSEKSC